MGSYDSGNGKPPQVRGGVDWRSLIMALAIGASGGATVPLLAPDVVSTKLVTKEDARQLERRMRLEIREAISSVCQQMPPERTRARIAKLERWVSQRDPTYTPGAMQWNDLRCGKI